MAGQPTPQPASALVLATYVADIRSPHSATVETISRVVIGSEREAAPRQQAALPQHVQNVLQVEPQAAAWPVHAIGGEPAATDESAAEVGLALDSQQVHDP